MKPLQCRACWASAPSGKGTWDVLRRNEEEITRARRAADPHHVDRRRARSIARARDARRRGRQPDQRRGGGGRAIPTSTSSVELIGGIEPRTHVRAAGRDRARQACRDGQQGAARASRQRDLRCGARAKGVMVAFEARRRRRHPDHQGAARGPHRQPHRVDCGNHQRHVELHPFGDARDRRAVRRPCWPEAQRRGYAEADPTFDVEGIDAAHKLTIMSAIAFGVPMQFDKGVPRKASRSSRARTSAYAEELGYRIKLARHHARAASRDRAARASDADPARSA